jgi:hypothetical protein
MDGFQIVGRAEDIVPGTAKTVQVNEEELAELRRIAQEAQEKKVGSRARAAARTELQKRHKTEYDGLVEQFKKNPPTSRR